MRAGASRAVIPVLLTVIGAFLKAYPAWGMDEADVNQLYAREATWPLTMTATRAKYHAWRREQHAPGKITLGSWHTTGPLNAKAFTDVLFPEQGVVLDAKAPNGQPVWQPKPEWVDGTVYDLPAKDPCATYLFRYITVTEATTLPVSLGSDDGLEVWINGTKVLSKDVPRSAAPAQDRVELPLRAGENALLLKVYNRIGGHGFYFSMDDPAFPLWRRVAGDFPVEAAWVARDAARGADSRLIGDTDTVERISQMITRALDASGEIGRAVRPELEALWGAPALSDDLHWFDLYVKACKVRSCVADLTPLNLGALRLAIQDLKTSYPDSYAKGEEYLERLAVFEGGMQQLKQTMARDPDAARKKIDELVAFQREALLANPLLDFDRLLLIKRGESSLGLPQNWQGNCAMSSRGYDNEIAILSPVGPEGTLTSFYKPEGGVFVGDVDLNFDGDKILFSMPGSHNRWQIWEINADGSGLRQVTPGEEPDVDNYDACYLPDGRIMFDSTRCFQGIPCVGGSNAVANLCRMDADGRNIRQLCFDQDHNWCPAVLNNGRVLYSRWEYSDTPHYFSRLLFHMNPDGTNQAEYYGSNSFWPNSIFYARPIPGSATKVVAIVSGHHGVPRMGELIIFDPGKARFEGNGVVQRIPGYGQKVEPVIMDTLVDAVWPRFLHPYPLSEKHFLVSCQPTPDSLWGLYLVDIFDNMTRLCEAPGYALFEPVPFRKTLRPPVVPDKVHLDRQDATVYLTDVYRGQGLKGVPRGTIKALRVYEFHYTYPQIGGHINIGVEGPWDVHRILGTVPVYEDGSAYFIIPANTPIAVQPLDAEGRAVQLMRSWFVGMPGEAVSCVGCHERQNLTPPAVAAVAARRAPDPITPWKGPARGFSFPRDVQPVLDKHCVGCHDGGQEGRPNFARSDKRGWGNFTPAYLELHPYVRRPGPESDYHMQKPAEFSATTSELIQMLEKGHHGVSLDQDAWERLYTWIDLNVPDHGTWGEHTNIPADFHARRIEMRSRYANRPEDPEVIPDIDHNPAVFAKPPEEPKPVPDNLACAGWPFDASAATARQQIAGAPARRAIDLGNGVTMELSLIPSGEFVMGNLEGYPDEQPRAVVKIEAPFWMGVAEVTNAQYRQFDPRHDSGFIDQHHKDHTRPGYSVQGDDFPVIRISWQEAMSFCQWLSQKTGEVCTLPTEAQWEWACRAGADAPFWYGNLDTDFSAYANLADASIRLLAVDGIDPQPIANPSKYQDFLPKEPRYDDGARIISEVAKYQPNPWGLCDMHGNVAEWTLSAYQPYPYQAADGRNASGTSGKKVVRGGSWSDRPKRAGAAFRLAYESWQPVHNVGFRVIFPVE